MTNAPADSTMSVSCRQEGNVRVLAVDGGLAGAVVKQFRSAVEQAFTEDGRDFVVDFAEVRGIDSVGLEALTWLRVECDDRLGMVKLCNLSDVMKTVLEITRLSSQFEQYENVDAAVKSLL